MDINEVYERMKTKLNSAGYGYVIDQLEKKMLGGSTATEIAIISGNFLNGLKINDLAYNVIEEEIAMYDKIVLKMLG